MTKNDEFIMTKNIDASRNFEIFNGNFILQETRNIFQQLIDRLLLPQLIHLLVCINNNLTGCL
jgi:hypothetical protein